MEKTINNRLFYFLLKGGEITMTYTTVSKSDYLRVLEKAQDLDVSCKAWQDEWNCRFEIAFDTEILPDQLKEVISYTKNKIR